MITLLVILFQNNNRRTDFHEFAKRWHSTTGGGKNNTGRSKATVTNNISLRSLKIAKNGLTQ